MQEQRSSPRVEELRQPPPKDATMTKEGAEENIHLLQSQVCPQGHAGRCSSFTALLHCGRLLSSAVELRRSQAEGRICSLH